MLHIANNYGTFKEGHIIISGSEEGHLVSRQFSNSVVLPDIVDYG
jgi:hypothetical protein